MQSLKVAVSVMPKWITAGDLWPTRLPYSMEWVGLPYVHLHRNILVVSRDSYGDGMRSTVCNSFCVLSAPPQLGSSIEWCALPFTESPVGGDINFIPVFCSPHTLRFHQAENDYLHGNQGPFRELHSPAT
ncbi:hypothetical protein CEXT_54811 [Caerostris extrusa]|uniref:Uncharacterized protein n=1 Tax=Caerostris extrusa TaxID=172846 RepID=A0AAV4XAC4_CAEEX|nr:hypothetical protein CEXT_54811 [Caerostris extrusa]